MIKKIIVASNNKHKIKEFREILSPFNIVVSSLEDEKININPEENGKTFKENAYIKANALKKLTNEVVVSDDSGLEIKALDGFPGVHSSRFMDGHTYEEKWYAVLEKLKNYEDKTANFKTVICIDNLPGGPYYFEGAVYGKIVSPNGSSGFGYDPIFYSNELQKTFGEATDEEKNSVSHRSRALKQMVDFLQKYNK